MLLRSSLRLPAGSQARDSRLLNTNNANNAAHPALHFHSLIHSSTASMSFQRPNTGTTGYHANLLFAHARIFGPRLCLGMLTSPLWEKLDSTVNKMWKHCQVHFCPTAAYKLSTKTAVSCCQQQDKLAV